MKRTFASWILIAFGICLVAFGAFRGEARVVLQKAVGICLECMGLG